MRRATVPAIDPRQLGLPSPARVALAHAGRLQASAIAAIEGRASRPGTPDTVLVRIEGSMATYRCPHSIRFGSVIRAGRAHPIVARHLGHVGTGSHSAISGNLGLGTQRGECGTLVFHLISTL